MERMAAKKSVTTEKVQEATLTRCDRCKTSPVPGMVFVRDLKSENIYDRIGKMVPCSCGSGDAIRAAYEKQRMEIDMAAGVPAGPVYSLGGQP